jgi:hypothetical protein
MASVLFPDVEEIVVSYLNGVLTEQVVTEIPNPRPASFVQVLRTGGPRRNLVTDEPQITVHSFGKPSAGGSQQAQDLAQRVRAWLHDLPLEDLNNPVYRVDELSGPANLPDPLSDQPRYTQSFSLAVRGYSHVGS